jgi:hypothetical protein
MYWQYHCNTILCDCRLEREVAGLYKNSIIVFNILDEMKMNILN